MTATLFIKFHFPIKILTKYSMLFFKIYEPTVIRLIIIIWGNLHQASRLGGNVKQQEKSMIATLKQKRYRDNLQLQQRMVSKVFKKNFLTNQYQEINTNSWPLTSLYNIILINCLLSICFLCFQLKSFKKIRLI